MLSYKESALLKRPSTFLHMPEIDTNAEQANFFFHDLIEKIYCYDQSENFEEEKPLLLQVVQLAQEFKNLNFANIILYNPFLLFLKFCQFYHPETPEFQEALYITTHICIEFFLQCGKAFAEDLVSSPFSMFLAKNMSNPVLYLFSIIVGESKKINKVFSDIELVDRISELSAKELDIMQLKYLFLSNFFLTCDKTDFPKISLVSHCLFEDIENESNSLSFELRLIGISRSIKTDVYIARIFLQQYKIIEFINKSFTANNLASIPHCLTILTVFTDFEDEIINDCILNTFTLPHLLRIELYEDQVIGGKTIKTLMNLLYNKIFTIDQYLSNGFLPIFVYVFENGSSEMKKNFIYCIFNIVYVYNASLSAFLNDEFLFLLISSICDSFLGNDFELFNRSYVILKSLLKEGKNIFTQEMIVELQKAILSQDEHIAKQAQVLLNEILEVFPLENPQ